MKKKFIIREMHCDSCAKSIEDKFKGKVNNISVSFANKSMQIDFDERKITEHQIKEIISGLGYLIK